MEKTVLSIEEQIEYLKNKNINFNSQSEKERSKIFFTKYNYLNIISLKYLFASGKQQSGSVFNHIYFLKTDYKDLEKKYKELLKFENRIREGILLYETELKVHIVMFFKEILEKEKIDFKEFISKLLKYDKKNKVYKPTLDEVTDILNKEWKRHILDYSSDFKDWNNYYYLLIKILSMGSIVRILEYNYNQEGSLYFLFRKYLSNKKINFSIGQKFNELDTVAILRNSMCHSESLITFLDKGYRKTKKKALEAKQGKWILNRDFLIERSNSVDFIYNYYMKSKNNKFKKLDRKSWIIDFSNFRLKNGKVKNFKKIKINL